jgi:hypothetical protein
MLIFFDQKNTDINNYHFLCTYYNTNKFIILSLDAESDHLLQNDHILQII